MLNDEKFIYVWLWLTFGQQSGTFDLLLALFCYDSTEYIGTGRSSKVYRTVLLILRDRPILDRLYLSVLFNLDFTLKDRPL